jgi:tripartite-type tricarboxylate transporter receptor subunit TctC
MAGNQRALGLRLMAGMFAITAAAGGAAAQSTDGFFKGKTFTINVGGTAGGGIDIGARMLARFIGKYLPGQPQTLVQLMPGAGGVRLVEYLYSVAPRDGTVIGAFATGPLIEPLISTRKVAYKMTDFLSVGALENDVNFCATYFTSPVKTLEDAKKRETTMAGTGAASSTDIYPLALNAIIGTKFRVITGYVGTQETIMAIERGETDGRCGWGYSSLKSSKPDWIRDKKINYLVQMSLKKHPDAADVPLIMDLMTNEEDRQMMRILVTPQTVTRPFLAPPGLPPERAKEVRAAFWAALNDKELRAEFTKIMGEEPSPTSGEDMQKLLETIYATPAPVVEKLRAILKQ